MRLSVRRLVDAARSVYVGLGLTVGSVFALALGVVVSATAMLVFGAATEDVTRHNGLARSDPAHLRFFVAHRSAGLDHVARVATDAGMVAVLVVVAAVTAVFFWYRGLRVAIAIAPVVSLALASIAAATTKSIVGRARPPLSLHLVSETDASFPSGHATNSTAVFVTIALVAAVYVCRRPIVRIVSVLASTLLAGTVGISRLILGVHWPSDVVAGWALGLTVALSVTIALSLLARLAPREPNDQEPLLRRVTLRAHETLRSRRQPQHSLDAA
jgi:undecaprenyl-diphosphatase